MVDLTDPTIWLPIVLAGLILFVFLLAGLFLITENEVGILTRRMFGNRMPPGQVIARHGQIGVQATTLMPGLYWRMPFIWNIKKAPVIEVGEANIATVESIDGRPLAKGRLLGDEIECNQFQDAEKFLDGGGFKGPQVGILRPGKYRINTLAFTLKMWTAAQINAGQVGIITAQDGRPLPSRLIIAPVPLTSPSPDQPHARTHNYFQDGPAFLDSGGFRGPQQDTLQPGRYYVNPLLFNVDIKSVFEVPPGFVAVLRSNIGEELDRSDSKPTPITDRPDFDQTVHSAIETILTTDRNRRGIWQVPVAPGKYNLNPVAFTAYLVPTSAIMVDWASSERPNAPEMSRPSTAPVSDTSSYPYLTDQTAKGVSFFQFTQLKVTSKDGFQLEVDVRMVIRILPENAAFIIARFGSVFNLIQQIVHPLIDASFRNNAGEKKALEFVQGRSQLQQEALEKARTEFAKYMVEAQNLLISYIAVDESLLATQTQKEIAIQQQAQYQQQALAEEQRIAVQEKTARANLQPQVVQAVLQVEINENEAKALVKQAEGIRDSTRIKADGEGAAVRTVGQAQADAYLAQAEVIGPERVALVRVMEQVKDGHVRITPDTLVATSGDSGGANTMITAYLATLLGSKTTPLPARRPTAESDGSAGVAGTGGPAGASTSTNPMTGSAPPTPKSSTKSST
jgi:regulator of protease activity HflC (stomatin/prohibitin superfamily)